MSVSGSHHERRFKSIHELQLHQMLASVPTKLRRELVKQTATLACLHPISYAKGVALVGTVVDSDELTRSDAVRAACTAHRRRLLDCPRLCILSTDLAQNGQMVDINDGEYVALSTDVSGCVAKGEVRGICCECGASAPSRQLVSCLCGGLVACCVTHLNDTAKRTGHDCLIREGEARYVVVQMALNSPTFPFLAVADPSGMVVGVVSIRAAINYLHYSTGFRPVLPGLNDETAFFLTRHSLLIQYAIDNAVRALRVNDHHR